MMVNNSLSWIVGLVIIALLVGAMLGSLIVDWLRSRAAIGESNADAQKLTDAAARVERDLAKLDNIPTQLQGLTNALTRVEQTLAKLDNIPTQLQGLTNAFTQATQARIRLENDVPQIEAELQALVQLRGAIRDMMLMTGLIVALAAVIGLSVNLIVLRRIRLELAKAPAASRAEQIRQAREMERLYREAVQPRQNGNGHGLDGNGMNVSEYRVGSPRRVE